MNSFVSLEAGTPVCRSLYEAVQFPRCSLVWWTLRCRWCRKTVTRCIVCLMEFSHNLVVWFFFSLRLIVHVNESSITTDAGSCYFLFTYLVWYSSTSFSATYLDFKKRMMCSLSLTMITEGNNDILQFYSGIVTNIFLTFRLWVLFIYPLKEIIITKYSLENWML